MISREDWAECRYVLSGAATWDWLRGAGTRDEPETWSSVPLQPRISTWFDVEHYRRVFVARCLEDLPA